MRYEAMSEFWMAAHSSIVLPFSHSVAYDELAIAEPHPNVCEQRVQPCVPCVRCSAFCWRLRARAWRQRVRRAGGCSP